MGRRVAAAGGDPAEDPAGCRASDRYHVVTEGRCFAAIFGEEPIAIEAGEVIVFTKGDPHALSSSPGMRADPVATDPLDLLAVNCRSSSTMAATV
jgi:Cupin